MYESITTPNIKHTEPNFLTELIILNNDINCGPFPWRGNFRVLWGKTVAALKKLNKVHGLSYDQIAFYIYKCNPVDINPTEFAKMAVVAKKLFQKFDLNDLAEVYRQRIINTKTSSLINAEYVQREKPKSLLDFLKELE